MDNNKLFVYGILKRGFALDLGDYNARFLGEAYIQDATLYAIGKGVGLRLNTPGVTAHGELWDIPNKLWRWLDEIETNGVVYTRKIVSVHFWDDYILQADCLIDAWVYEHTYPGFKYDHPIAGGNF